MKREGNTYGIDITKQIKINKNPRTKRIAGKVNSYLVQENFNSPPKWIKESGANASPRFSTNLPASTATARVYWICQFLGF
jgi:hypothetical protein